MSTLAEAMDADEWHQENLNVACRLAIDPAPATPITSPLREQAAPCRTLQFSVGTSLEAIEREVIVATLAHCRGRKKETAELLGVSLKTLYNRLNEYRKSTRMALPAG